MNYRLNQKTKVPRRVKLLAGIFLIIILAACFLVHYVYDQDLRPVNVNASAEQVTINTGSTLNSIANLLQKDKLVRSSETLELYVAIHNERNALQAGTYKLSAAQSTPQIVAILVRGKVTTKLVTIVPGQRLDEIRQTFIKAGFSGSDVDAALNADQYKTNYPAAADIPVGQSLEGFLYPNSYQKIATTDPHAIVEEALIEMQQHLTPPILKAFAAEGLTAYQGVTLASIVEEEVSNSTDRPQVAQVFLSRLSDGMPLGSDVTAYYGAIIAGVAPSVDYDSPYNTLMHTGLPPGPISTVSASSLNAVAHPASTNWLYFVSGDDGITYFSTTLAQQQANTAEYCHALCHAN
jgi:UPF0755 protein